MREIKVLYKFMFCFKSFFWRESQSAGPVTKKIKVLCEQTRELKRKGWK